MSGDAQFAASEIVTFLANAGTDLDVCVVGGQALNLWAAVFAIAPSRGESGESLTSKDLDFLGSAAAARELASRTTGQLLLPTLDDHTPSTAVVYLDLHDKRLRIDFIDNVLGVERSEILPRSSIILVPTPPYASSSEVALRLMHPVHCLQSRAANILHPAMARTDRIALLQYEVSVQVVKAWIKRAVRSGLKRDIGRSLAMLGSYLSADPIGDSLHLSLKPDPLTILKLARRYKALDERYRTFTLANMIARIEKRRAVLDKIRGRKEP